MGRPKKEQKVIYEFMITGPELKIEIETLIKAGHEIVAIVRISGFVAEGATNHAADYLLIYK